MELQFIELTDLKTTNVNVRKVGAKETSDLVPSIKSLGLLQPLLVRPNCEPTNGGLTSEGFEIVAGQRRYHALLKIAEDETPEPVPCVVMEDSDDAKAIEASLAENIARLPMDETDQYKAFSALGKQGQTVEDISSQFGITERLVKQRLALGNLHAPILTAFRKDQINAQTIRTLTMATPTQQRAWWELAKSDEYTPTGDRLKQWLFGGGDIPVENALFDVANYDGATISDLFGEEVYFDNAEQFWALQNQAIADAKENYLANGWGEVVLLDVGSWWPQWNYISTSKEDGGRVYAQITKSGEVTFHEGYITEKEYRHKQAKEKGKPTKPKAEITKGMQNYLDLQRHAAVRTELLGHSGIALRLAVAQIIAGSDNLNAHADPQKANTVAIKDSLASNKAEDCFAAERQTIRELLGSAQSETETVVPLKDEWHRTTKLEETFAKLVALDDETVTRILTFVIAETLPSGSAMVEVLGNKLNVDMADYWQTEDTTTQSVFFDLLRDKQAINGMLKHIGGKSVADGNVTATAKVQKQIIKDYLNGERAPKNKDWQPRYMAFPMQAYTDKGGIEAMIKWKEVKKHFA